MLWRSERLPWGVAWAAAADGKATASCLAQTRISVVESLGNGCVFSLGCKWFLESTFHSVTV